MYKGGIRVPMIISWPGRVEPGTENMNIRGDKPYYELYNLASDPSERHNVLDQYPDRVAELKEIMIREHRPDPNWPLLPEERKAK